MFGILSLDGGGIKGAPTARLSLSPSHAREVRVVKGLAARARAGGRPAPGFSFRVCRASRPSSG
jgi:hypothetical protein